VEIQNTNLKSLQSLHKPEFSSLSEDPTLTAGECGHYFCDWYFA